MGAENNSHSEKHIWIWDTSALITLFHYYPPKLFPDVYTRLDTLIAEGQLCSNEYVREEIGSRQDKLFEWTKQRSKIFLPVKQEWVQEIKQILLEFPQLVNPNAKKDSADPWLVAQALVIKNNTDLFSTKLSCSIVTAENPKSGIKIPAACKAYDIKCCGPLAFFAQQNWLFRIEQSTFPSTPA